MCDPGTAFMAMAAAGTAVSAAGAIQESQAEARAVRDSAMLRSQAAIFEGQAIADAAERTAELREEEALDTLALAGIDEDVSRETTRREMGQQEADLAAAGRDVSGPTAMALAFRSARAGEIDALNIRTRGQLNARALRHEAREARIRGADARTESRLVVAAEGRRSDSAADIETAGLFTAGSRLLAGGARIAQLA